jgi:hypothetical protein
MRPARVVGIMLEMRLGVAPLVLTTLLLSLPARAQAPGEESSADPASIRSLRSDLERLVEVQQSGSWRIDRYEIEDMMPHALLSVCRSTPAARVDLLGVLEARIKELGGPVEAAYAKNKDLSSLKTLLFVSRVRDLLAEAIKRAPTECPFQLEPQEHFRGVQGDDERFSLNIETGGLVQLRRSESRWTYGGGGLGRLLLSRGFGGYSLMAGPELAGGAMLQPGAESFVINYFPAIPLVLRIYDVSWHWDLETAALSWFQADDTHVSFGVRAGLSVGVQSRRARGVIPWAGLTFAYEHYFAGPRPAAEFLRGGLRVGLVWN